MPIIPKYEFDTRTQAAPALQAVPPDRSIGQSAEMLSGGLDKVSAMLNHQQDIRDQLQGHNLSSARAVDLEDAWTALQNAPLKTRPGADVANVDAAVGEVNMMPSTATIPRSETVVDDWKKITDQINKKYAKLAGTSATTSLLLANAAFQQDTTMAKRVVDFRLQQFQHENMAKIDDNVDLIKRSLGRPENAPPRPRFDGKGNPVIDPAGDEAYQTSRAVIDSQYKVAIERGWGHPDTLTQARNKARADLDHQRAQQIMARDPGGWNLATRSGTNRWQDMLTEGAMDHLNTMAVRRENQQGAQDERLRKRQVMVVEQNFGALNRQGTLTHDMVDQMGAGSEDKPGYRLFSREETDHWHKTVDEQQSGEKWPQDPALVLKYGPMMTNPNVTRAQVAEMRSQLGRGKLNTDFLEKYTAKADSIINQRESVGREMQHNAYSHAHSLATALLRPPPEMGLKDPKDYQNWMNAVDDLEKWQRDGKNSYDWERERFPIFLKDNAQHHKGNFDFLNGTLGMAKLQPNEKGAYTDEEFKAAIIRAGRKAGFKSQEEAEQAVRSSRAPVGYIEDLNRLKQLRTLNTYIIENKAAAGGK